MLGEDFYFRYQIDSITARFGNNSAERKQLWRSIDSVDNLHNAVLKRIIKQTKKYPGYNVLGKEGSKNFWNLVQHQDHDTAFQLKVLNLMHDAMLKNNASPIDYAYLYDRVMLNTIGKQYFGTQFQPNAKKKTYEPRPLIDSINVDSRRKQIGLHPIKEKIDYLNRTSYVHLK